MSDQVQSLLRSEPVKVAGGPATEGPVWHPDGHLFFVRMGTKEVIRWDPHGGERVVREQSGKATGCTLDIDGHLVMCEADTRQVTRMYPDGTTEVIASEYEGHRLNQPNDLICDQDGAIYFTDPQSTVPKDQRELDSSVVFKLDLDGSLSIVTSACAHPNGLVLSPDGTRMYIANSRENLQCDEAIANGEICTHRSVYALDRSDYGWSEAQPFVDLSSGGRGVPDGLAVDAAGRIYCACAGMLWLMEPSGELIGKLELPGGHVRNFAFGGDDYSTLFIASGSSIFKLEMDIVGVPSTPAVSSHG